jgi:hypothetical protein
MDVTERPHWSFWAIGVTMLVWNAMGCANYLMQADPETLAGYSEAARSLVSGRPAWATGAFAVAVFGGALGCLLMLLRRAIAWLVLAASLAGVVVTNIHTFGHGASPEIWAGSVSSLVLAAFLAWYARLARRRRWIV